MEAIYEKLQFRRAVLGVVLAAANECGYRDSRKVELLYWCSEVLDNRTIEELESLYLNFIFND